MTSFADFQARGEAAVLQLIETAAQESLHLEMKGGRIFTQTGLDRKGKESLASAMASFANSAGGLLVIGVDCRPLNGVDAATSLSPIGGLDRALTLLTELVGDGLQPKHDGIVIHPIRSTSDPSCGYLVVDVPRSSRRPHMNSFTKSYFKRSGGSKFAMEHYDVEDAFKRQTGPELTIEYDLRASDWPSSQGTEWRFALQLAAKNEGQGIAKHIVLRYPDRLPGISRSQPYENQIPASISTFKGIVHCALGPDTVVHPSATTPLHRLFFTVRQRTDGYVCPAWDDEGGLHLACEITAEGMQARTTSVRVPFADIEKHLPIGR